MDTGNDERILLMPQGVCHPAPSGEARGTAGESRRTRFSFLSIHWSEVISCIRQFYGRALGWPLPKLQCGCYIVRFTAATRPG